MTLVLEAELKRIEYHLKRSLRMQQYQEAICSPICETDQDALRGFFPALTVMKLLKSDS